MTDAAILAQSRETDFVEIVRNSSESVDRVILGEVFARVDFVNHILKVDGHRGHLGERASTFVRCIGIVAHDAVFYARA